MKRAERHHLKENPVAVFVTQVQEAFRERGSSVVIGVTAVLAIVLGGGGYFAWQQWQNGRAGSLLAEALTVAGAPVVPPPAPGDAEAEAAGAVTEGEVAIEPAATSTAPASAADAESASDAIPPAPAEPAPFVQPPGSYPSEIARLEAAVPKLLAAADAYPSSLSGITARYQAAAGLVALGRTDEAAEQYRQVISAAGDRIYGRMATLGLAETHLLAGDYEAAIALLEGETAVVDSDVPVDAVLMRLGRAYRLAGRPGDALAAFTRVVEEFPGSLYFLDAQREAETLRSGATVSGA